MNDAASARPSRTRAATGRSGPPADLRRLLAATGASAAWLLAAAGLAGQAPAQGEQLERVGGAAGEPGEALEAYRAVPEGGVYRFTMDYRGGVRVRVPADTGAPGGADERRGSGGSASSEPTATRLEVHLSGTWRARVYRRGPGGPALAGWALTDPRLSVRQAAEGLPSPRTPDTGELEAQLEREVLLRVAPAGDVEVLLLPSGLHPLVESFWKQWAGTALLAGPRDGAPETWAVEGEDRVGEYRDAYRDAGGGEIVRTRETYRLAPGRSAAAGREPSGARIGGGTPARRLRVRSESRYQVDPERGYLASGSGSLAAGGELAEGDGAPEVLVARSFRFAHESFERRDAAELRSELTRRHGVDRPDALDRALVATTPAEPASGREPGGARGPGAEAGDRPRADGDPPADGGRSVPTLLDELETTLGRGVGAARPRRTLERLRRSLGAAPGAAARVEEHLERLDGSPRVRGALLDVLADAGTPEAQAVLARRIEGPEPAGAIRRTLLAAGRVERPSDELWERVRELSRDEDAPPAVRREALRTFGALASGRDVRSFGPEGPVDLLDRLGDLASSGEAPATRRAALHALGNTRLPTAVGPVRDAASDAGAGAGVLEAGVAALEQLPTAASVDALAGLAGARADAPALQHRVVSALVEKARSPEPRVAQAARERLADVLGENVHPEVRLQALDYWIDRMLREGTSRAVSVVERAARDDPAAPVRQRSREALEASDREGAGDGAGR